MRGIAEMDQLIPDPSNLKDISREVLDRMAVIEPLQDVHQEL